MGGCKIILDCIQKLGIILYFCVAKRPCSLMDKIKDSGSLAVGSIPARVTKRKNAIPVKTDTFMGIGVICTYYIAEGLY